MTKISNKGNSEPIELSSRLLGTDQNGKTKNYILEGIVALINSVAGKDYIQFKFSPNYGSIGLFSSNEAITNPTQITKLFFNKQSVSKEDLTALFTKIDTLQNIVIELRNPSNSNNFAIFKITNITNQTEYFELDVTLYKSFYSGNLVANATYSAYFDVKENFEDKLAQGNYVGTAETLKDDIETRQPKVAGKSLVDDTEITKLSHLDDTTDLQKPVSTATAAALADKLSLGGYVGTAQDLEDAITAAVTGVTGQALVPSSPAFAGTGIASGIALEPGTYTNLGGVVVNTNSIAVIARDALGAYSITQTALVLTGYVQKTDIIDSVTSTETQKAASANSVNALRLFNNGVLRLELYYNKTGENGTHPTLTSTPLIPITNSDTIKFLTSQSGGAYDNYVFFDDSEVFISSHLSSDLTLSGSEIPANAKFIGINSATGTKQIVYVNDVVVFGIPQEQKDIKLNTTTNTVKINKATNDIVAIKSLNSEEAVYANLLNGVNESNIFTSPNGATSVFEDPGYLIESSAHNSFIYTTNEFNYTAGKKVALVANLKFNDVTDDFILKAGFFDGGFLASTPEYTASDFGLQNLSGTTQTISLIWNATKASWILFYAYKSEMAAGNSQSFTIQNFAVLDLGVDGTNPLYNKNTAELAEMFQYSYVSGNVVNYSNVIVKTAEKALDVQKSAVTKSNKNYGKKLGTGGDSLTANLVWQPKLVEMTGLNWSSEETSEGVGFVRNDGSYLPAYKPNDDGLTYNSGDGLWYDSSSNPWRKAYKMAIGGTAMKPNNADSISIRMKDVVRYNIDILFIYAGQNDPLDWWKTTGTFGLTYDEIVANETPWFGNTPNNAISTIAAYKGLLEYIMNISPKTIIYLVTQMKVLGKVGMNPLPPYNTIYPSPRFVNTEEVMNWEKTERLPRCEYIKSIGKLYGLPVIDLYNETGVTNQNAEYWYGEPADDCTQVHPEDIGYHRMAEVMEKHL